MGSGSCGALVTPATLGRGREKGANGSDHLANNDGYSFFRNTPWPIVGGIVPLVFVTLGFTFLGEALLDIFVPKARKEL